MKLVILKEGGIYSFLTKLFTGCSAYHTGFLAPSGYFYDMNVMRRRVKWDKLPPNVELFECRVSENYLIKKIINRTNVYGVIDYFSFLFRWLGFKVKNRKGLICSEMTNNDLRAAGYITPWKPSTQPPSPCDILKWANNNLAR